VQKNDVQNVISLFPGWVSSVFFIGVSHSYRITAVFLGNGKRSKNLPVVKNPIADAGVCKVVCHPIT
jgi:hypothetical protein